MYQCTNCGSQLRFSIEDQKLKCDSCQSLFDPYEISKEKDAEEEQFYEATVFKCPQCGGEILSSDNTASNFCSFCGASTILTSNLRKEKRPNYIIPFKKTKEDCKKAYTNYMRHAIFAPKELKDAKFIDGFRGIYMPYWAYNIKQRGHVTFPGSKTHRRGDYIITDHYNLSGDINAAYKGLSYDASSSFDDNISEAIAPYDVKNMNRFTPSYLSGFYADTADVDSNTYLNDVEHIASMQTVSYIMKQPETSTFEFDGALSLDEKIPNECAGVDGAMFPVWFLSYRNKDRVAYATVNGQTGKVVADLPVATSKYMIGSLLLAIPIFLLLNMMFTFRPTITLSITTIIASIVTILFSSEISAIKRRDAHEDDRGSYSGTKTAEQGPTYAEVLDKKKKEKEKKKRKTSFGEIFGIILPIIIVVLAVGTTEDFNINILSYIFAAVGIGGYTFSVNNYRKVTASLKESSNSRAYAPFPQTIWIAISMVISILVMITNPVSDIAYYFCVILNLAAIFISLLSLINYYNILATRKLPQFTNYKGGDDRA